jgi:hypothetical protein
MKSKYGFPLEERDAISQSERARRLEEKRKREEETKLARTFFLAPRVKLDREPWQERDRKRSDSLTIIYRIMDDFRRATSTDFEFRDIDVKVPESGDPIITVTAYKDQWYKLPPALQEQLIGTLAKFTRGQVSVKVGEWNPTFLSLFGR